MPSVKFLPLDALAARVTSERENGRRIALANGGFDLLHVGHIRYLQEAKNQADVLVVGINSDVSLRRLKGESRALIDEQDRVSLIAALACVDYVTLFDSLRVDDILRRLKPDVHCKGSDYTPDTVPERATVREYGGRIAIVGGPKIRSTSEVIARIRSLYG